MIRWYSFAFEYFQEAKQVLAHTFPDVEFSSFSGSLMAKVPQSKVSLVDEKVYLLGGDILL